MWWFAFCFVVTSNKCVGICFFLQQRFGGDLKDGVNGLTVGLTCRMSLWDGIF